MRSVRIFLLHFQDVFEKRGQSFVWLLVSFIAPLLMILFWRGARALPGWTQTEIASYYFLIIIINSFVMTHIEERVGNDDIMEGQLAAFLLKPYSYYWLKFYYATTHRILQGIIGAGLIIILSILIPHFLQVTTNPILFALALISILGGFFVAYVFKLIVGFLSFWMTEAKGLYDIVNILIAIFAGYLMPISLFPDWLSHIASFLPFMYMIYFPVLSLTGKLTVQENLTVIAIQLVWIVVLYVVYKVTWNQGIKKFTSVGQ